MMAPPFTVPDQRVTRYRFGHRDRIEIDGVDHVASAGDRFGYALARYDGEGLAVSLSHEQIRDLHVTARLKIFEDWYSPSKALLRNRVGTTAVADLPKPVQIRLHWRVEYCERFLRREMTAGNLSRSDKSMPPAIAAIYVELIKLPLFGDGKPATAGNMRNIFGPPSPTTLRRWLRAYEASGFDPIALRPGHYRSGDRIPRLDGDSYQFALHYAWIYASSGKPTKAMIHAEYGDAVKDANVDRIREGKSPLQALKRRSFERMISRLPPFAVCVGREGYQTALRKFSLVHRGLDVTRALERVEMDEFRVSLQTIMVEAGIWEKLSSEQKGLVTRARTWLSVAIDCATRCILAMRLLVAPPSHESALATIEMALFEKTELAQAAGCLTPWDMHGKWEGASADGGAAFIAIETRSVLADLEIAFECPPGGMPNLRGTIERFFLTVRTKLLTMLPGQTFEHVVARGSYDAEGNACLDIEELNRALIRWIVDIYHDTPHEGLAGETPRQAWRRLNNLYLVKAPPLHLRTHVFGLRQSREIGNHGIRYMGLDYQSMALQNLRVTLGQKKVEIRVNRHNLGAISIQVGTDRIMVPCVFSEMIGISLYEWMAAAEELRRRHADCSALGRDTVQQALAHIRSLANMAIRRAEIGQPVMSKDTLDHAERDLFRAFAFADRAESDDEDLLGGANTTSPPRPPAAPRPVPDEFGDPADWFEE